LALIQLFNETGDNMYLDMEMIEADIYVTYRK